MARAWLFVAALVTSSPCFAQTGVIRGRVIVAGTERPLAKVEVRASSSATGVIKASMTDGNGRYTIESLPAGRYTVTANKINFVRASFGERRPQGAGQPIEVVDGKTIDRVDFALQRTGVISGRIVDEFGDPLTDAQVMLMRYVFANGERRLQPFGGLGGGTNDLGEYRVFGLAPGQYFVTATLRNTAFGSDASARTAYVTTYYPGTGNVAEAQRLTVQPGQTISGINMTLLPVTASRVSGVAFDSDGRAMAGANVSAMQRVGVVGMPGGGGSTVKPDGTFTINGLAPGEYTIRAGMTAEDAAMADVTVSGGDVSGVQLVAAKRSTVRGRVVFDAAPIKPPIPASLRISAFPTTGMMGFVGGMTTAKDDWTFEIKAFGGFLRMTAGIASGPPFSPPRPDAVQWRVKHVSAGDTDITDSGFDLAANTTVENIVIEMTTQVSQIDARVVDASGAAVNDAVVVLFPPDSSRWVSQSRFMSTGRPDQDGVFHGRVPAGDYLIVAFDDPEPILMTFTDPDVLAQLRDRATPVSIGDGEKKSMEIKLSEPPVY